MQNRYWIYICKEILYDKKGRSIHEIAKKREQNPQYWISLHGLHLVLHQFSSVAQSCPTLQPHGLQHTRSPCPSPTPGVYSNSSPLSWWCHPTISSSVIPFSSYLQSFPASGSFEMSQFFTSGGRRIGVSASESVLPMNIQDRFPLEWTAWIQESSWTQFKSIDSSALSFLYSPTLTSIHDYWKNKSFD